MMLRLSRGAHSPLKILLLCAASSALLRQVSISEARLLCLFHSTGLTRMSLLLLFPSLALARERSGS
jgi:hypothetical protein